MSERNAGPTTSPEILMRPAMAPSQSDLEARRCGGTTSAISRPKYAITTARPVHFTRSRTAEHVALNLETGMRSIAKPITSCEIVVDTGRGGSEALVNAVLQLSS